MKQEYDIWNEVLETLGFKFHEEYTKEIIMWRSSNLLIYKKDSETAKLYVKFETGEVTSFFIDGWQYHETFQNKNKELFRSVKLKYLLD
jgi:hypothetical protein